MFAGELAGGFAGTLVGSSVNGFTGVLAGGLVGGLAGQYGWSGAGITEYLVFLALVCAASFLLREVVALARKRMRKPDAATETIEA